MVLQKLQWKFFERNETMRLGQREEKNSVVMNMRQQKWWITRWTFIYLMTSDDSNTWHNGVSRPQEFWEPVLVLASLKYRSTQTFEEESEKDIKWISWYKVLLIECMQNIVSSETTLLAYLSHAKSNYDRTEGKALTSLLWPFLSFGYSNSGIRTSDIGLPSNIWELT